MYFIILMKRALLFLLCFTVSQYNAKMSWIKGIISPSTPTELDSITVFIDLSFAYSDCPFDHKFISVLGNNIQSSSHHCQGSIAAVCDTRDTLLLAPLPIGTYKLVHSSTSSSGSVPCTPGFVVDDVDSIEFHVVNSALSSVTFKVDMNNVTENYSNPEINATFNSFCGNRDTMGRLIKTNNTKNILISNLESGPYILVKEQAYKYLIDKF